MSLAALPNLHMSSRLDRLRDRGLMLAEARSFFASRGILEVDVPACTSNACIDENIDLMTVHTSLGKSRYLQSSPEYGMKRLLSEGIGDIYQIGHVFRDGEVGSRHNPEFTMAEWYRCGFTYEEMIEETFSFIELFLHPQPRRIITYRKAMQLYARIDSAVATDQALRDCLRMHNIELSSNLSEGSRDDLLNLIMGCIVEPFLGQGELTAVADFPASQCALAEIELSEGFPVAKRFEVYFSGQELANGYKELRDPSEQKERFQKANAARLKKDKTALPLDPFFLNALENGLPPCCGVAVGFDRLMMLRHQIPDIQEVIPYSWDNC